MCDIMDGAVKVANLLRSKFFVPAMYKLYMNVLY